MLKQLTFLLLLLVAAIAPAASQTRVVCVGNSVTAGYTLTDASTQAWPARLGALLGSKYVVYNCGVSGTTMLSRGASPYVNTSMFTTAKNYNPDILIISLGTNDAHPDNWQYKADFYNDYSNMIAAFRQNGRNPQIYLVFPVACYADANQSANLQNELIPLVSQIAKDKGASIIDFNTPTQNSRNTLYNDGLHPNAAGATILGATAFNTITPTVPAFYSDCNYGGHAIKLTIGDYPLSALTARGMSTDDVSSIKVPAGYTVYAYVDDNFSGNYLTLTADNSCLGGWDNLTTSIRVRANGVTGKNGTWKIQNRNSGKYIDVEGASTADGANVLQWQGNTQTNQQFTFTDQGGGLYKIISVNSGKAVDITAGTTNNLGNVEQWTANNGLNQQFIVLSADNNYFKLKAAHSGRILEIVGGGLNNGDHIDQYDDNNQTHGHWALQAVSAARQVSRADTATVATVKNGTISIAPNPVTNTLRMKNVPAQSLVQVFDMNGRTHLTMRAPQQNGDLQLNTTSLRPGTYLVRIGNTSYKFIKQ